LSRTGIDLDSASPQLFPPNHLLDACRKGVLLKSNENFF